MADENVNVNLKVNADLKSVIDMKKEFRALQQAMSEAGKAGNTQLFDQLAARAGELKNDSKDLQAYMRALDPGELLNNYVKMAQGIVGGFAAATGALNLFGVENETLQEIEKKSAVIIQTMMGLEQARAAFLDPAGKAQLKATIKQTQALLEQAAAWALANPYAAAAIVIAAGLTAAYLALNGQEKELKKQTEGVTEATKENEKKMAELEITIKSLDNQIKVLDGSMTDLQSTISDINDAFISGVETEFEASQKLIRQSIEDTGTKLKNAANGIKPAMAKMLLDVKENGSAVSLTYDEVIQKLKDEFTLLGKTPTDTQMTMLENLATEYSLYVDNIVKLEEVKNKKIEVATKKSAKTVVKAKKDIIDINALLLESDLRQLEILKEIETTSISTSKLYESATLSEYARAIKEVTDEEEIKLAQQDELIAKSKAEHEALKTKITDTSIYTNAIAVAKTKIKELNDDIAKWGNIPGTELALENTKKNIAAQQKIITENQFVIDAKLLMHKTNLATSEKRIVQVTENAEKEKLDIVKTYALLKSKVSKEYTDLVTKQTNTAMQNELASIEETYKTLFDIAGTDAKQVVALTIKKGQDISAVYTKYALERLSIEKEMLDLELSTVKEYGKEYVALKFKIIENETEQEKASLAQKLKDNLITQEQYNKALILLAKKSGKARSEVEQSVLDKNLSLFNDYASQFGEMANKLATINNIAIDRRSAKEEEALQREYDSLDEKLASNILTEEQYAKKKLELDEKKAKQESEIKRKQANQEKTMAIFSATISLAEAITKALAGGPPPFNIALAAISAGLAGAQLAAIIAAPIPEFATGGLVEGPGTGSSDSITAKISNGEYIVREPMVKKNKNLLESINNDGGTNLAEEIGRQISKNMFIVNNANDTLKKYNNTQRVKNVGLLK